MKHKAIAVGPLLPWNRLPVPCKIRDCFFQIRKTLPGNVQSRRYVDTIFARAPMTDHM